MIRLVQHKGREREFIGQLKNFEDLPLEKQENFRLIKQLIFEVLGDVPVFVFGSYYHGFWDELSDYDVAVLSSEKPNIEAMINEKTNLKTNVFYLKEEMGLISIP
jgi:predicted nucleotidyltransferase